LASLGDVLAHASAQRNVRRPPIVRSKNQLVTAEDRSMPCRYSKGQELITMSNDVIIVRLPPKHAAFLQANLAMLAMTTRQAMMRPGLEAERRVALGNRASLLETIEDAVHGALLEMPRDPAKGSRPTDNRQSSSNVTSLSAA
jgi:hypothetical protein